MKKPAGVHLILVESWYLSTQVVRPVRTDRLAARRVAHREPARVAAGWWSMPAGQS
jgi:hypothetical protein